MKLTATIQHVVLQRRYHLPNCTVSQLTANRLRVHVYLLNLNVLLVCQITLRVFIALCLWLYVVTKENHTQIGQENLILEQHLKFLPRIARKKINVPTL